MDPLSNANRIAALLRQRLQERATASGSGRLAGRAGAGASSATTRKAAVRSPEAVEALDDRRLKRALIENILADQFGQELLNDARFQQVVDRVTEAIDAEKGGGRLLARAVSDLRAGRV